MLPLTRASNPGQNPKRVSISIVGRLNVQNGLHPNAANHVRIREDLEKDCYQGVVLSPGSSGINGPKLLLCLDISLKSRRTNSTLEYIIICFIF